MHSKVTLLFFCISMILSCQGSNSSLEKFDLSKYKSVNNSFLNRGHIIINYTFDKNGEVEFYNEKKEITKRIRVRDFSTSSPIRNLKLPLVSNPLKDPSVNYFKQFSILDSFSRRINLVAPALLSKELSSLSRFGIKINNSDDVSYSIVPYYPNVILSELHGRFITTIEWASFYKILVPTRDDPEEKALIDCSWLTVYDVKGDVYKQFMIPDKLVETAIVSEDGNYMICETMSSWTNIAGELYYEYNGFLIINLLTNNIIYLNDDILKNDAAEILYADSYFQIYFSTGYRVYLNPEKKTYSFFRYYIKDTRGKKQVWGKSFEHYLGLRESLEQMQVVEY